ncbi:MULTISPECIES: hypothetical protein [Flammeovirga]|uniref:Uncharacterized protein n=1 Tax=Flammeovirga agarivorans TaxID=2726742 RepID=A0A7X8XV00_9BACT|nr:MULTISPECIES: hypothetical protein [Flammeovirga]NLR90754.1 hypothetical protein [Flammeovirga agarivorans]
MQKEPFELNLQECYAILKGGFVSSSEEVKLRSLTMLQAEKLLGLRNKQDHSSPKFYGNSLLSKIEEYLSNKTE